MTAVQATPQARKKNPRRKADQFFTASLASVRAIAEHTDSAAALVGYLALCRSKMKQHREVTTAGAKAIGDRTDKGRRTGGAILDQLNEMAFGPKGQHRVLVSTAEWNEEHGTEYPTAKGLHQTWVLPWHDEPVNLPASLLDGWKVTDPTPLQRVLKLPRSQQIPTLLLLLHLYAEIDYQAYGGINPNILRVEWNQETKLLEALSTDYGNLTLLPFSKPRPATTTTTYIRKVAGKEKLTDVDEAQFWAGLNNLVRLGLVVKVATVFDADPVNTVDAQMLYPLYYFNRHMRQQYNQKHGYQCGEIGRLTMNLMARAQPDMATAVFGGDDYSEVGTPEDHPFVAIAHDTPQLLTIFRPRWLAANKDYEVGRAKLIKASRTWAELIHDTHRKKGALWSELDSQRAADSKDEQGNNAAELQPETLAMMRFLGKNAHF